MTKILCIDDTPNEILASGQTLKETINNIFKGTHYEVIFEKTGAKGIELASKKDSEIELVLLDVEFNKEMKGPKIADELQLKAPHVKVIVLTRVDERGKKISFGWKRNVVHYVLKKEIAIPDIQNKLRNLCKAVIEDFSNKNWIIEYMGNCIINLSNTKIGQSYGINIPPSSEGALKEYMKKPNCPVMVPSTTLLNIDLNKLHHLINENVLKGTDWNTWGILTKEGCATGQLKLVIGSVEPITTISSPKDPYILQSQFDEFKQYIERRLNSIEQTLNLKKPLEK